MCIEMRILWEELCIGIVICIEVSLFCVEIAPKYAYPSTKVPLGGHFVHRNAYHRAYSCGDLCPGMHICP